MKESIEQRLYVREMIVMMAVAARSGTHPNSVSKLVFLTFTSSIVNV